MVRGIQTILLIALYTMWSHLAVTGTVLCFHDEGDDEELVSLNESTVSDATLVAETKSGHLAAGSICNSHDVQLSGRHFHVDENKFTHTISRLLGLETQYYPVSFSEKSLYANLSNRLNAAHLHQMDRVQPSTSLPAYIRTSSLLI